MIETKIVEVPKPQPLPEYPRIVQFTNTGSIVLMFQKSKGVVLESPNNVHRVGYYADCWADNTYELYPHDIIIRNVK